MAALGAQQSPSGQCVLQGGCVVLEPQDRGSCMPQGGTWPPQLLPGFILYNKHTSSAPRSCERTWTYTALGQGVGTRHTPGWGPVMMHRTGHRDRAHRAPARSIKMKYQDGNCHGEY